MVAGNAEDSPGGANDSEAMAMDSQSWKWYLEDLGLASNNEKLSASLHASSSETLQRDINCLPHDAAICTIARDRDSSVLERLSLLHVCVTQDISAVEYCLKRATSQQHVAAAKVDLFNTRRDQARSDFKAVCDKMCIPPTMGVETTADLSKAVNAWVHTELRPSCRGLIQDIMDTSTILGMKPIVHYHDEFCRDRNVKPPIVLPLLSRTIAAETATEISDFEDFHSLMLELESLAAFLKGRRFDNSSVGKGNTLSFMVQATPDNSEQLDQHIQSVDTLLDRIRSNESLAKWVLWEGKNRGQSIKNLQMIRSRMECAQQQFKQSEDQLSSVRAKVQTLRDDLDWCRSLVEDFRKQLEEDIGILLKDVQKMPIRLLI